MFSLQFRDLSVSLLLLHLCCVKQGLNLVNPTVSMRLRTKRTCSELVCFGDFHIQRFSNPVIFLRGELSFQRLLFFKTIFYYSRVL
ncbi:hypothetical protein K1719_039471 [Acacia pycnantha]|nr:hypothetical protein K1719_039471 [Acacia pycnantha]